MIVRRPTARAIAVAADPVLERAGLRLPLAFALMLDLVRLLGSLEARGTGGHG